MDITMDGSDTLVICGTLNMGAFKINMNNGGNVVHVSASGTVTGSGGTISFSGAEELIVYGSFTTSSGIDLNDGGGGAAIYIGTMGAVDFGAANMNVQNDNNVYLSADASFQTTGGVWFNNTANLCLEEASSFDSGTLNINSTNAVTYGGAAGQKGCLSYSGASALNNTLTAFSNISLCQGPSSSCGACQTGSAALQPSCASCGVFLPVEITHWSVTGGAANQLNWRTGSEFNNDYFLIERSKDGTHFETWMMIQGGGTTSESRKYQLTDGEIDYTFYRLLQVDYDGTTTDLGIRHVKQSKGKGFIAHGDSRLVIEDGRNSAPISATWLSLEGKVLSSQALRNHAAKVPWGNPELPSGMYLLQVEFASRNTQMYRVMVVN